MVEKRKTAAMRAEELIVVRESGYRDGCWSVDVCDGAIVEQPYRERASAESDAAEARAAVAAAITEAEREARAAALEEAAAVCDRSGARTRANEIRSLPLEDPT